METKNILKLTAQNYTILINRQRSNTLLTFKILLSELNNSAFNRLSHFSCVQEHMRNVKNYSDFGVKTRMHDLLTR